MNLKKKFVGNWGQLDMKYKLSEVMDLIGGGTPKTSKPEYWDGNIPWLSVKDFNNDLRYVYKTEKSITPLGLENSSTKLLQRGDVIISARGTVGEIATIPFPMAFNQSCYGLRAKEGVLNEDYLYYLIKHNVYMLKKNTHGSVFDTITRSTFDNIEVDVPSLKIQEKVASLLSDFDRKIEINNAINNKFSTSTVRSTVSCDSSVVRHRSQTDVYIRMARWLTEVLTSNKRSGCEFSCLKVNVGDIKFTRH